MTQENNQAAVDAMLAEGKRIVAQSNTGVRKLRGHLATLRSAGHTDEQIAKLWGIDVEDLDEYEHEGDRLTERN